MRYGHDRRRGPRPWSPAAVLLTLLLAACAGTHDDPMEMTDDGTTAEVELLTYGNFGDAFLRDWCRGCHSPHLTGEARSGAPDGVDFATAEDVEAWADRIAARAANESPTMPPAGGPTTDELDLLAQWLDAGAP